MALHLSFSLFLCVGPVQVAFDVKGAIFFGAVGAEGGDLNKRKQGTAHFDFQHFPACR